MPTSVRGSRIGRLIDRYGLVGMGTELESRWTSTRADSEPLNALEDLTTYFNTAIVRSVCGRNDADPDEDSPEQVYRALTVADPADADTPAVRTWLADHGIDPDALTDDFITLRTMHRYLRAERDLDLPRMKHPPEVAYRHDITAANLDARIERTEDQQQVDRMRFIRQLYEGKNVPAAAEAVGCHPTTGYRWLADWEDGGLKELLTDGTPGWFKLTPREERVFVDHLASSDRWTSEEVQALLVEEFDITYSERHLRRKLKSYGLESIPQTNAYRWPVDARDDAARRAEALDQREDETPDLDQGHDLSI